MLSLLFLLHLLGGVAGRGSSESDTRPLSFSLVHPFPMHRELEQVRNTTEAPLPLTHPSPTSLPPPIAPAAPFVAVQGLATLTGNVSVTSFDVLAFKSAMALLVRAGDTEVLALAPAGARRLLAGVAITFRVRVPTVTEAEAVISLLAASSSSPLVSALFAAAVSSAFRGLASVTFSQLALIAPPVMLLPPAPPPPSRLDDTLPSSPRPSPLIPWPPTLPELLELAGAAAVLQFIFWESVAAVCLGAMVLQDQAVTSAASAALAVAMNAASSDPLQLPETRASLELPLRASISFSPQDDSVSTYYVAAMSGPAEAAVSTDAAWMAPLLPPPQPSPSLSPLPPPLAPAVAPPVRSPPPPAQSAAPATRHVGMVALGAAFFLLTTH